MTVFNQWLKTVLPDQSDFTVAPLKGDASFRHYFRVTQHNQSYIAVNSPPVTENNTGFIQIAHAYEQLGLHVPHIYHADLEQGFLLLSDLGDRVFLHEKNNNNFYIPALITLNTLQACELDLPSFDHTFIKAELDNFTHWYLEKEMKHAMSRATQKMLNNTFNLLIQSAITQPQCHIHRDYHSRNLMILDNNQIGLLDFQDGMTGPVTYDLVSLIKDCYIKWPDSQILDWALFFHENFLKSTIPSQEQFLYYFDLMGIQRHLKASFIFARKYHRDNQDSYLKDIPRTLSYILSAPVINNYPKLNDLHNFRDFLGELIT